MTLPDTSVLVAAFATWHESHEIADRQIGRRTRLIAHTAFELVSTLTRLPEPFRTDAEPALQFLDRRGRGEWLTLDPRAAATALRSAVAAGIRGGSVYDALVAAAAHAAKATLLTLDRRAEPTYRALGVRYELLA